MIEEAVHSIGSTHAGLIALIGGAMPNTRLFPVAEDRKHALPVVLFEKGDPFPIAGIWQDSGWYKTMFTFIARAATAKEAKQVIAQVRAAYQRFHGAASGHDIEDAKATGAGDEYYDNDLQCYAEEIELEFFHN